MRSSVPLGKMSGPGLRRRGGWEGAGAGRVELLRWKFSPGDGLFFFAVRLCTDVNPLPLVLKKRLCVVTAMRVVKRII